MFSTVSSLKVHMRLHTGSRPYPCPHNQCDRTFRTSGHLQAHLKAHVNSKKQKRTKNTSKVQQYQDKYMLPEVPTFKGDGDCPLLSTYSSKDVLVSSASQDENSVITADQATMQMGTLSSNISNADYLQMLGSLQLPMDSLQNIQISNLDINGLPSEDILQNFIFVTPSSHTTTSTTTTESFQNNQNDTILEKGTSICSVLPIPNSSEYCEYGSSSDIASCTSSQMPLLTNSYSIDKSLLLENVGSHSISTPEMNCFSNPINDSDPFLTVASEQSNLISNITANHHVKVNVGELKPTTDDKQNGTSKQCPDCGRMFSKPSLMVRHRRIHTGEKPHVCNMCGNTFTQKSSLDTHVMFTHSDLRPFKCSMCPFQTVQKAALKKHCSRAHPQLMWTNLAENGDGNTNSPGISILNSSNPYGTSGATVTTTQINITTGVRDNV